MMPSRFSDVGDIEHICVHSQETGKDTHYIAINIREGDVQSTLYMSDIMTRTLVSRLNRILDRVASQS